jgi:hypothetical protein
MYADEVLAHADTHEVFLFANSPAQVRALSRLGNRARTGVTGDHTPADILRVIPEGVESLNLCRSSPTPPR